MRPAADADLAIAQDLGYLTVPPGVMVEAKELADLPPHKQVLISTGSQGEPLAALSRMSQSNHHFVSLEPGDTVVLASSLIPGNENAVYRVINGLSRLGANVVHKGNSLVHVSGLIVRMRAIRNALPAVLRASQVGLRPIRCRPTLLRRTSHC